MKEWNLEKALITLVIVVILLQLVCIGLDLCPVVKDNSLTSELRATEGDWLVKYGDGLESTQTFNIALAVTVINNQAKAIKELDERLKTIEDMYE